LDLQTTVTAAEADDPATALHAVASLRGLADQLERNAVVRARIAGWSWREVGAALGVSGQAAHKKHRRDVP